MENYQDEGGRIAIPQALHPYMRGVTPHRRPRRADAGSCVTNDDGIHAEGLAALERDRRARSSDDVWVCAPETEQSGASRALTLVRAAARAPAGRRGASPSPARRPTA